MNHTGEKPIVFQGWLFDVVDGGIDIILWIRLRSGRMVRLFDPLPFPVYAAGERSRLISLGSDLCRRGLVRSVGWETKREFWSGAFLPVLRLDVPTPATLHRFRRFALDLEAQVDFFNVDLPVAQHYLYLRRIFPASEVEIEALETGEVLDIRKRSQRIVSPTPSRR